MTPLPPRMRAVHQPDATSSTLILASTTVPQPTPGHVLVRVIATAPCYSELTWAAMNPEFFPADKEPIPGQDMAGIVVCAGNSDSRFKPGDEVFCRLDATRPGGLAEYTTALESELAHKPSFLSWIEAAATPLSALTAWQALFVHGGLDPAALLSEDPAEAAAAKERNTALRVLITAAGGSVGGFAIQFAAAAGAQAVVGVCSTGKVAGVLKLGATAVVDYHKESVAAWMAPDRGERRNEFDLVLDCVGGESAADLWEAVRDGGDFISISDMPDRLRPADNTKVLRKSQFFIVQSLGMQLAKIARVMATGCVRPLVDSVYEFEDFQAAFAHLDRRSANGKIVIRVSKLDKQG